MIKSFKFVKFVFKIEMEKIHKWIGVKAISKFNANQIPKKIKSNLKNKFKIKSDIA